MAIVSIIVPVYNSSKHLRRCIDSILSQSLADFELILIDDGSTDDSWQILNEYNKIDNRIKIYHNSNHGVSFSRNFGIEKSNSKYITFVDSDDRIEEHYLLSLFNCVNSICQLAICDMNYLFDKDETNKHTVSKDYNCKYIEFKKENDKIISECIDDKKFNFVCGKIFSSEIIKKNKIKFEEDVSLGEDTLFVMEYLRYIDRYCLIDAKYYTYFKHNGSLSMTLRTNMYDLFCATNDSIENLFFNKGLLSDNILMSIDIRRINSAEWVCYALTHSEKEEDLKECKKILNEKKLRISLKRLKHTKKINDVQCAMSSRHVYILKLHYNRIEGKFNIKHIIKKILISLKIIS